MLDGLTHHETVTSYAREPLEIQVMHECEWREKQREKRREKRPAHLQ